MRRPLFQCALMGVLVVICQVCHLSMEAQTFESDVKRLTSDSWQERSTAFDNLRSLAGQGERPLSVQDSIKVLSARSADNKQALTAALVTALSKENELVEEENERVLRTGDGGLSDEHTEFYANLVKAVCSLQDPQTTGPLLQIIDSGDMVVSAVASLGKVVLPHAFDKFGQTKDESKREGFVLLFGKMLQPQNIGRLDQQDIQLIRRTLFDTVKDRDYSVRLASVRGLSWLSDPDTVHLLQQLAATDPSLMKAARQGSTPQEVMQKSLPKN
jgi:HEAT repeat protein